MSIENMTAYDIEQEREEFEELCRSWNWNAHPIEVAKELNDICEDDEEKAQRLLDKIQDFFSVEVREQIDDFRNYV